MHSPSSPHTLASASLHLLVVSPFFSPCSLYSVTESIFLVIVNKQRTELAVENLFPRACRHCLSFNIFQGT